MDWMIIKTFSRLVNDIKEIIQTEDIRLVHVQNNWQLAIIAVVKLKLYFLKKIKIIYTLHGFRHNSFIKSIMAQFIIGTGTFSFCRQSDLYVPISKKEIPVPVI